MVYWYYKKLRIIFFRLKGLKAPEIEKCSLQGLVATRQGIQEIIKRYEATGSIGWTFQGSAYCELVSAVLNELITLFVDFEVR